MSISHVVLNLLQINSIGLIKHTAVNSGSYSDRFNKCFLSKNELDTCFCKNLFTCKSRTCFATMAHNMEGITPLASGAGLIDLNQMI